MKIFLQGLFGPSMWRLIGYIGILLVAWTTIIFWSVSLPITQTHPAKIVFAAITLHVVTSSIFFNANLALRTNLVIKKLIFNISFPFKMFVESECYPYFSMSRDVVGRFAIICTFGQPMSNRFTIGWCMVFTSTSKTKNKLISNLKQENDSKTNTTRMSSCMSCKLSACLYFLWPV